MASKVDDDDMYTVKVSIEKRTGQPHRLYRYNGKPCKRLVLTSRTAIQLGGYRLIEKDLRNILNWLIELETLNDERATESTGMAKSNGLKRNILTKGLFVASLATYGKCFGKADGRLVKLEKAQLDAKFRSIHEDYMRFRHNFAAHSGVEKIERCQVVLVFPTNHRKPTSPKLFTEVDQPNLIFPHRDAIQFKDLIEHVQTIVVRKIEFLIQKVIQEGVVEHKEYFVPL